MPYNTTSCMLVSQVDTPVVLFTRLVCKELLIRALYVSIFQSGIGIAIGYRNRNYTLDCDSDTDYFGYGCKLR
jgi:hypothetical protein